MKKEWIMVLLGIYILDGLSVFMPHTMKVYEQYRLSKKNMEAAEQAMNETRKMLKKIEEEKREMQEMIDKDMDRQDRVLKNLGLEKILS